MTDYFGKAADKLCGKRLWLFDMDGTVYEEDRLFEGALELLAQIEKTGGRYVFITNNSSKSVKAYIDKVNRLGIRADYENFFTSSQATILYLNKYFSEKKIYCQGTQSFVEELITAGIHITETVEPVDAVVVGFDTELTSGKIRNTCEVLNQDVPFIATNPDLRCPVSFGFIPDCGSICQMIENATGRTPLFIGKPEKIMIDFVRKKFGFKKEETVVIGDRLYTDIASGINAGCTSVAVLTGETSISEILSNNIKPDFTVPSVNTLYQILTTSSVSSVAET